MYKDGNTYLHVAQPLRDFVRPILESGEVDRRILLSKRESDLPTSSLPSGRHRSWVISRSRKGYPWLFLVSRV